MPVSDSGSAGGRVIGRYAQPEPVTAQPWECAECGHANAGRAVCDACGVSRHYLADPPLDLPFTPRLTALPSFWLSVMWSLAALAGVAAALLPGLRETFGIGTAFLVFEVPAAALAAGSCLLTALWERWFNQAELKVPNHVRSGEEFEVELRLVPYRTIENVSLTLRFVDRFYERTRDGVETASKQLESSRPLTRGKLTGRRAHALATTFVAPFPITPHADIKAEIMADILGVAGTLVPALRHHAQNLREHGGYYVEARVRVGLLSRRLQKRVLCYLIGDSVHFG